ncbi:hypothetical protein HF324_23435 [Chitinophaga oryzae]|uniref:Uncharacterized protein n=1 Tax=Chitinophaga oryzae TaxID=2725414 RepID=A0ABX6LKF3_9BACT|nr:hypothetical protein [Chitinophaga oryzae]QJB40626.1 hypothetical protein HF324_23435 [Chitinophaga oryzae]
MKNDSLYQYIRQSHSKDLLLYDNLRYVLEGQVYYYGNHFLFSNERRQKAKDIIQWKELLKTGYAYYNFVRKNGKDAAPRVLSNAYFNFNAELERLGYAVLAPCWSFRKGDRQLFGDMAFYKAMKQIRKRVFGSDFNDLTSEDFSKAYYAFRSKLADKVVESDVKALFVPNDVSFFENLSINVFKELKKPSFIFLHGLPGRYNIIDENRTDYLIVWGNRIKQHYIDTGFSANKIFVAGHPFYKQLSVKEVRSGMTDILVLAKVGLGSPHSDGMTLYDRGAQIVYLLEIQKVLQQKGIKQVRLRFHPSANPDWHYQFIDRNFFVPDFQPLNNSLQKASLVIGPVSTVFLEALYNGVNYMVFEPSENGVNIFNELLVAPFNGKEEGVPFAGSGVALHRLLTDNVKADTAIFNEYVAPFDIGFIKEIT